MYDRFQDILYTMIFVIICVHYHDQQSPQAPLFGDRLLYNRSIWQVIPSTSTMR